MFNIDEIVSKITENRTLKSINLGYNRVGYEHEENISFFNENIIIANNVISKQKGLPIKLYLLKENPILYGDILDGNIFSNNIFKTKAFVNYRSDSDNPEKIFNIKASGSVARGYRDIVLETIEKYFMNSPDEFVKRVNRRLIGNFSSIMIPASPGEVVDKISILEIKMDKISDKDSVDNVSYELLLLNAGMENILEQKKGIISINI